MKKLLLTMLGAMALVGCVRETKTYTLDGVPVVLEYGEGPEREHMALAVGLFREGARNHWSMDDELTVWRSLREIRWMVNAVEGQALYRYDEGTVYANWYACALDVPLYQALADHYGSVQTTDEDADDAWADALQEQHEYEVCSSSESGKHVIFLPW